MGNYTTITTLVRCNAPRRMCKVSSSYSLSLPCHSLACCISSCHHLHSIIMFFKNLHSSGFPEFSPLFVLSPTTLARARGMSEILFYKWRENVLRMGWKLACAVVMLLVGRPPSFIAFEACLIAQPLNYSDIIVGQNVGRFRSPETVAGLHSSPLLSAQPLFTTHLQPT